MATPELPPNIKLGQVRRTVGIVTPAEWSSLTRDERDAADALALHVWFRCRQKRHPALEGEDCVFLTDGWVQALLRVVGARKTGEKAAAAAVAIMQARGWMEDTGETKKPRRTERSEVVREHSYWWRVFRVPAISRAVAHFFPQGAYATIPAAPPPVGSLSAFLRCQGLIPRRGGRSRPNPGSVQWVFLHSGPP
jgi:hypothetical protein